MYANVSIKSLFYSTPYFSISLEQLPNLELFVKWYHFIKLFTFSKG